MMPFLKMHGLGNDFVVIDARELTFDVTTERASRIANRRRGIGCDQFIIMRKSECADVFMEIWNADGSCVGACGNATRCIGQLMLDETSKEKITIETEAGLLTAVKVGVDVSVNMGKALLNWDQIPLAAETATDTADITIASLSGPGCVNMGNPHAVFFVEDADAVALSDIGPQIENNAAFPERVNASVASVKNGIIRLRVWERGAGITEACGTAACASVVAATRRNLVDRKAIVRLDGGDLMMEWLVDGTVQMTGPATLVFKGEFDLSGFGL
tara:strand:+ start:730 stop:1548 length:819 start_codon:yes stop_codon:yes gene_type:complete